MNAREVIARRAAAELRDGEYVNLGIGLPTLIPRFLEGKQVFVQTENGLLGVGPRPLPEAVDPDLVDAGKEPITALRGASFMDSAAAFGMIRGGHLDAAVLGALQVSQRGDIANWAVPGRDVLGVGGAMDLVRGARRVIVAMTHTDSHGRPKIVRRCTLPLTAPAEVDVIITELAVFDITQDALRLRELQPGVTLADVRARTEAEFLVS